MKKKVIATILPAVLCLFSGTALFAQNSNITASAMTHASAYNGTGNSGAAPAAANESPVQEGDGMKLLLTPNPATNEVTFNYESAGSQSASIRITDGTGVNVMKMGLGDKQKGSVSMTLGNLAKGSYIVELVSGSKKVTQQLVKQ